MLDPFVREFLLLDLPMVPVSSDLPTGAIPAIPRPPAESGEKPVDPRLAPLAAIAALNEIGGDLSDGQKKFHAALSALKLETPLGLVTLNENRQASGTVYVNEVVENADGTLSNKMVA
ncbi:MAG TPA: hypothetical protein PKD61_36300, partial [Polyangiaceae bacterium]|nr:hypothetical protein [Polyangiaceae bacterium]